MKFQKPIVLWLFTGVLMIYCQILLGGITRLTGSGLSITQWEIVTGTFPPLSSHAWQEEFDEYKATPQYQKINRGMSMGEFKWIYFWEYLHRLWARLMGFVFLIPFLYFLWRKRLNRRLVKRLGEVVLLGAMAASFGWIMVLSGLSDRPWVNAYKLSIHLLLGLAVFALLLWTTLEEALPGYRGNIRWRGPGHLPRTITIVLIFQLFLGGLMSGMHAGLYYPTFPGMNGQVVPAVIQDGGEWTWEALKHYDQSGFAVALVQFCHRLLAYLLFFMVVYYLFRSRGSGKDQIYSNGRFVLGAMLIFQVLLGILTVINSKGSIPLILGVLHQAGAMLLLGAWLINLYLISYVKKA